MKRAIVGARARPACTARGRPAVAALQSWIEDRGGSLSDDKEAVLALRKVGRTEEGLRDRDGERDRGRERKKRGRTERRHSEPDTDPITRFSAW